jgi:hypothetical protein
MCEQVLANHFLLPLLLCDDTALSNSHFAYSVVTTFAYLYFGCHLYCTNSYRFKTASLSSSTSSPEMIFVYSHCLTEKLLFSYLCNAAGPPLLILITYPETCVQRACDKKRSGTENVNDDQLRSDLKPARTSSEKSCGCSQAAKCPPLSSLL